MTLPTAPFNLQRPALTHCSNCGAVLESRVPPGDGHHRLVCPACGTIHYENPKLIVGCLPVWEGKLLLCRRAIEPRYGYWTLPAGFMENGETTADGAARETLEEAGAQVNNLVPFSIIDVSYVHQVHFFFLADLANLDFSPGEESLEVRLFAEEEIPWSELAFYTVIETMHLYYEDRKAGKYGFHNLQLRAKPVP
ncbi:MAG: ADP-ribose pyrophosphatase [Betaproteobacteria bacterium]|nr:ADP-ribose pyrophosphatase [Betaproteobacteria bacterium]